jgi:hypothetical protein
MFPRGHFPAGHFAPTYFPGGGGTGVLPECEGLMPRQLRLYRQRINVYRPADAAKAADGKYQGLTWTFLHYAACVYIQSAQSSYGLMANTVWAEGDNLFTLDQLSTRYGLDLRAGDHFQVIYGKGLGSWYVIRGNPQESDMHANKQLLRCAKLESAPMGLA